MKAVPDTGSLLANVYLIEGWSKEGSHRVEGAARFVSGRKLSSIATDLFPSASLVNRPLLDRGTKVIVESLGWTRLSLLHKRGIMAVSTLWGGDPLNV